MHDGINKHYAFFHLWAQKEVKPLKWKMDLNEQIPIKESKAFTDAQKVTSILLNLINQLLGRPSKNPNDGILSEAASDGLILLFNKSADTAVLAHNITTFLMKKYANDSALWDEVAINLENEEVLWKEAANRRLSHVTSSILITIYVRLILFQYIKTLSKFKMWAKQ